MTINQCAPGCRGEGSDSRGKAQWLVVQEGKSAIFFGGRGGGITFIFRPGCLNRMIHSVTIAENMTIKRRTTGFGLKRPGDGVAALVL
jgi:hypothetical protein